MWSHLLFVVPGTTSPSYTALACIFGSGNTKINKTLFPQVGFQNKINALHWKRETEKLDNIEVVLHHLMHTSEAFQTEGCTD